ncbi:uncharacterized protein APUU_12189A [Aspergillus puulaauensis]|uniref:Uncharacterized protein n=1 Tax=Aspergillus puulaauensis TaxID=1220207 RepID=A0A7R8AHS4_9EURO|nr:uncharacterized protein APUU_12189A [Aspergillus puulaauensis]BCS19361.1 hypothetical protein APUU_12189A [Aspergillus puulaauensis]
MKMRSPLAQRRDNDIQNNIPVEAQAGGALLLAFDKWMDGLRRVDATARVKRETKSDGPFAAGELISFSGSGDRPSPSGRWIPRPVNTQLSFSASSVAFALSPFLEGAPLCSPGQPLSYTISLLSPVVHRQLLRARRWPDSRSGIIKRFVPIANRVAGRQFLRFSQISL